MTSECNLTDAERRRYGRHLILPEVGLEGQLRLKAAKVLLVGAGGLGSPSAMYLAAAGVGTLGIVDFDRVDLSNLHRQVIHGQSDVGRNKVDSAADRMAEINPHTLIVKHTEALSSQNALQIVKEYDVVVDGTDNFPTRYLVNDACVLLGKPNVYGSIFRFEGQATIFAARGGPCYRCLFPEPPPPGMVPSCAEAGVLGVLPGIIGVLQATEAIKLILGLGEPLVGRLMLYDSLQMSFREVRIKRDPECPICGDHPTQTELIDYEAFCGISPHANNIQSKSPTEVKAMLDRGEKFLLVDVRNPDEYEVSRIDGSILIPLPELEARIDELDPNQSIVIHCHSGKRSAQACEILIAAGFDHVANMEGGISRWLSEIG